MSTCARGGAVVFGGSRGIGKAICYKLAKSGYSVAVASRSKDTCQSVAAALPQSVGGHVGVTCDLGNPEDVQRSCIDVEKHFGRDVKVLVNCAGVTIDGICPRLQLANIHHQLNINLVGPMLTCKHFSSLMMRQRHGSIVNIGSVTGSLGNAGQGVYSASKAGLTGFTKCLAKEMARFGVRANIVEPGFVDTDMTSDFDDAQRRRLSEKILLQRFGRVEEVADAVMFVLENSYMTGQVLKVDGGLSLQS